MIVCLEGISACGKTTHAQNLVKMFGAVVLSFPNYETPIGKTIHGYVKGMWKGVASLDCAPEQAVAFLNAWVLQALQMANRMERASELVDCRAARQWVVLDRYWPSSVVSGEVAGLSRESLVCANSQLPQPDLFLLLDADADQSRFRQRQQMTGEDEGLEREADLYRQLWSQMSLHGSGRWIVVDARVSMKEVARSIQYAVENEIARRLELC